MSVSVHLSPIGNAFQFFNANGKPLSLGNIYTYAAGTSTPQATYSDSAGLIPNADPLVLGTDGRIQGEIWLTDGQAYKFVLKDAGGSILGTYDNITTQGDTSAVTAALLAQFSSTTPPTGASLVGYKNTISGAVASTVQTRLQSLAVNVKADYGAKGDGATDDITAITAAITAVNAAGGGIVYFPPGTYVCSSRIVLLSNVYLQGAGMEVTKIRNTNGASPTNIIIDARGVLGTNYPINTPTEGASTVTTTTAGNAGNFTPGGLIGVSGDFFGQDYVPFFITTVSAVNAGTGVITLTEKLPRADLSKVHVITSQITNIGVSDMSMMDDLNACIIFKYVRNGLLQRVFFESGTGTTGWNIVGSRDISIRDCIGNGKNGGHHSTMDSLTIGCRMHKTTMIFEGGCEGSCAVSNTFDNFGGYLTINSQSQRCSFIGNVMYNVADAAVGISIDGAALVASGGAGGFGDHIVSGNIITGGGLITNYGISIGSGSKNNVVTGNRCHALGFGVHTAPAGIGTAISGNAVTNCTTSYDAIEVADSAMTRHLRTCGTAPAISFGTGAGTGPSGNVTGGNDTAGTISMLTGAGPAASSLVATITFDTAFDIGVQAVLLFPANVSAGALAGVTDVYIKQSATTAAKFEIWAGSTNLTAATTYQWSYVVIGN